MTENGWISIVLAIIASLVSPLVVAGVTDRRLRMLREEDRKEKKLEWKRQDEIGARLNGKLEVVHTLVNSQMTDAKKFELESVVRELVLMKEVIALHRADGREPSADAINAVSVTEAKIEELGKIIAERLRKNGVAEKQTEEHILAAKEKAATAK